MASELMNSWQLRKIYGQLLLTQEHSQSLDCPCELTTEHEFCIPKHLIHIQSLAEETIPMAEGELSELLGRIAGGANDLRRAYEEAREAGEEPPYDDIVDFSREARKELEPHLWKYKSNPEPEPDKEFDPVDYTVDELEKFVESATAKEAKIIERYATDWMLHYEKLFGRLSPGYRDYDNLAFLARRRLRRLGIAVEPAPALFSNICTGGRCYNSGGSMKMKLCQPKATVTGKSEVDILADSTCRVIAGGGWPNGIDPTQAPLYKSACQNLGYVPALTIGQFSRMEQDPILAEVISQICSTGICLAKPKKKVARVSQHPISGMYTATIYDELGMAESAITTKTMAEIKQWAKGHGVDDIELDNPKKSKLPICTPSRAKARESCIRQLKPRQKAGEIRSAYGTCTAAIGCRPGRKGEK